MIIIGIEIKTPHKQRYPLLRSVNSRRKWVRYSSQKGNATIFQGLIGDTVSLTLLAKLNLLIPCDKVTRTASFSAKANRKFHPDDSCINVVVY